MSDEIIPDSTYPKIELPVINSDIPPHLLTGVTEESKYILEQISVLGQYLKWSAPVLVAINDQTRKTNGRVIALESWRTMFKSWWGLTLAAFAVIGGVASIIEVWQYLIANWPK
jgi:hypothetical protein